ncbi:hypothetical protein NPIL_24261 [Nephila pilipes]|uniref:Uncharacterized protein n=1 Tax=Nephila pilipes TaxID=299642 RepID=A0A8X6UVR7_NEPPI|nr:hypothetical protein NPIL_24261 [Nephila pilipes]
MDLDENNAEEYSNEDQTENEEIYILREQLDASRQQLEYAEGLAEERKICMDLFSARIEELERALAESQRGRDSEIYEVAAEDRSVMTIPDKMFCY